MLLLIAILVVFVLTWLLLRYPGSDAVKSSGLGALLMALCFFGAGVLLLVRAEAAHELHWIEPLTRIHPSSRIYEWEAPSIFRGWVALYFVWGCLFASVGIVLFRRLMR